jgi:sulfoxide reductase heme-binding subunit YedZ
VALADSLNRASRRVPVGPLYPLAFVPAGWWLWLALNGRLGADPVATLEHALGLTALQFLIAALAVTPLREITGVNLLRVRRMLGLMAFWYAVMHVAVWVSLDRQFDWARITADLFKRPYIIVGMVAFLMLVPLAATSFDSAIRRMGPVAWRRLHRLAYPASLLAAAHFVWLVKAWPPEPLIYGAAVIALVAWRFVPRMRRWRRRAPAG